MTPDRKTAALALEKAGEQNPGPWIAHSSYVAQACWNIADHCLGIDAEKAYVLGLLHDIGRYAGVTKEKHLLDGYRFCKEKGWDKPAQICISHSFMIQDIKSSVSEFDITEEERTFLKEFVESAVYDDYDLLVQLCDALALPTGFCILEKRFVDVALRYGTPPATVPRWKRTLEIKAYFEEKTGCSIYSLLPGAAENSVL